MVDTGASLRQEPSRSLALAQFAAAAVFVGACSWLGVAAGIPTLWSPLPMLTIVPGLFFGPVGYALPVALFVAWSWPLARSGVALPTRSIWLLGICVVLSVAFFWASYDYGVDWEGEGHTLGVIGINALVAAVLVFLVVRLRRLPSHGANLLFHALLFGWLGWCAFPWLGELL